MRFLCFLLFMLTGWAAVSAQPSVNRSFTAFTIPEKDLLPENIAYDPVTATFFVGSTRKGKVIRIRADGSQEDFIPARTGGLWMVIGMKVDAERRILWVCSSGGENLVGYAREGSRPAGVFKFDLDSGRLLRNYVLDQPDEVHFFNDVVIAPNGDVFITHMFETAAIYKISQETEEMTVFTQPETGFSFPNGLALDETGLNLYVAHREGVSMFSTRTGTRQQIAVAEGIDPRGIDGLYYHQNHLIGVHDDRVVRYRLRRGTPEIIHAEILEQNHPMFMRPTTGVLVSNTFYYIANAQFDHFHEDGTLFPMDQLYEVVVLKINL